MTFSRVSTLRKALQMTRSSPLTEATAVIQRTLSANLPGSGAFAGTAGNPIHLTPARNLLSHHLNRLDSTSQAVNPLSAAEGGFVEKSFADAGKSLQYRLYVPANATAGMPLVVMLHGCTQSAEDFARGTGMNALADELGFLVAYPNQTHAANAQKCWNWFKPSDQQRDRGEPALIAGLTRQVISEHSCDRDRVYVAGLSAGGAAAAVMASAYPDLYAAVGIHSGLPCGAARDIPSALMAMRQGSGTAAASRVRKHFVPVITFHGDRDATVSELNSRQIVSAARAEAGQLSTQKECGQVNGGHRFTREVSVDSKGEAMIEQWTIHGGGHAWFGGSPAGTYTDALGPDASREMIRFFLQHRIGEAQV